MKIINLHRKQQPFAIVISKEITGNLYSVLYQDRYIICLPLNRHDVKWFSDNQYLFKIVCSNKYGEVYEYKQFRKKMNLPLKHNFLVRHGIISKNYL